MVEAKEFIQSVKPNWCPGCGGFSVLNALTRSFSELDLEPHNIAAITGIGCSGRISGYLYSYGFHAIHGRALPVAQGVKLANNNLTVVAVGGDGDGLGIGLNHLMHAMRRNVDITYVIIDNHIYGLTKGQTSPTSPTGTVSKTTPGGSVEEVVPPLQLALSAGVGFLAQGYSGDPKQLARLIQAGIKYKGFSLIVALSTCVTYNKVNTMKWYRERLYNLEKDQGYSPDDRLKAINVVAEKNELVTGIVYQKEKQRYGKLLTRSGDAVPVHQDLTADKQLLDKLMTEFV
ncbi:2-oxoacid:ferredoxin oxidoreductase subunit beta [Metallumcola ferriviriculae]|uniref:2-oxoacid:ferredoxin oxidoreductase subunit beta n=1 Tax=Metallumcola ferriviriculae TaxID=3039180 RepID=A0AAU0UL61_9FIRM|nr:2-oxoacid:ferredoxin oxidoreductase subunit beta [Desulfitibacteraceae bacterium MK1]